MGAVRARRRGHVRGRTRQGRAWPATTALVAAAASAWFPIFDQHRHGHPSRRTGALQQRITSSLALERMRVRIFHMFRVFEDGIIKMI